MQIIRGMWRQISPQKLRRRFYDLREHFRIELIENGHWRSVSELSSVDKVGNPIPWISYPAIQYLNQLDFSAKTIFEYGSGNSTLYWAARAKGLISVESDEKWYRVVSQKLNGLANSTLILAADKDAYITHICQYAPFDVIFIDGNYRLACAEAAVKNLCDDGMIILDNSETHPHVTEFLRNSGLIQVDMIGFAPIISKVQATSFFLRRNFMFAPRKTVQPSEVIGKNWTQPAADEITL